jgi:hypothetical protein
MATTSLPRGSSAMEARLQHCRRSIAAAASPARPPCGREKRQRHGGKNGSRLQIAGIERQVRTRVSIELCSGDLRMQRPHPGGQWHAQVEDATKAR